MFQRAQQGLSHLSVAITTWVLRQEGLKVAMMCASLLTCLLASMSAFLSMCSICTNSVCARACVRLKLRKTRADGKVDKPEQGEKQQRVWQWRQETLGLFRFAHGKVKDGCGIWATPEASFPPFFPILLSLYMGFVLFLTRHWLNTMEAFISPCLKCWKRKSESRLLHWEVWVCSVMICCRVGFYSKNATQSLDNYAYWCAKEVMWITMNDWNGVYFDNARLVSFKSKCHVSNNDLYHNKQNK